MKFSTKFGIALAALSCVAAGGLAEAATAPRGPETVRLVEGRVAGEDGALRYIVDSRDAAKFASDWKSQKSWLTIIVCPLPDNGGGIYDAALPEVIANPADCQTY